MLPRPQALDTAAETATAVAATIALGLPASVALDDALDKLQGRVAQITNTDANGVRCHVARPAPGAAPTPGNSTKRPAVIVIHQILGLQQREVELCQDLAAGLGYVAVAPDTFKGQATLWPFRAIFLGYQFALRQGAPWGVPDLHAVMQWLKSQPDVDPQRITIAGFCYGGGAALRYCAAHPGEAAGCVVFYGRPLAEASDIAKLGGTPVLGLYGTRDAQFPVASLDKFKADLRSGGVPAEVVLFEGEGHAFVKDLQATRAGGAAGRAWGLFRDFLRARAA